MNYVELAMIDPSTEDDPVGTYGMKWFKFMQGNHPKLVKRMITDGTLVAVARSVDNTAWDYRELLDAQYEKSYPRPNGFEEIVRWETTRTFYTDGEVMRDKVLICITAV
jgi:hypothetical protein